MTARTLWCRWTQNPDGDWNTACGHEFIILEGTPAENDMLFCCYCGSVIEDAAPE